MKKISFLLGLALVGLFVFSSFSIDASNPTIAERFASANIAADEAASGAYNFDKAHSFIGFRVKPYGLDIC